MILVTGGAGYVGSHFVHEYLRTGGKDIIVIDDLSNGHKNSLPSNGAQFFDCAGGDKDRMREIFSKFPIEAVIHFAASAYVGESHELPFKYFNNNIVQSINLFEVMEEHGVRKLVFSSTCATYGNPEYVPIDEEHRQLPINVYGNTKLIVEKILRSLAQSKNWSYVALRYFNAAGAAEDGSIGESHDPETHLIPLALQAVRGKVQELNINGDDYETPDGTCVRDYIHVTDLAHAHQKALELMRGDKQVTECINLGTQKGASIKEVIEMVARVTGNEVPIKYGPRRPGDPPTLVANAAKAKQVLKWEPQYDLRKVVETAWKWEQNRRY